MKIEDIKSFEPFVDHCEKRSKSSIIHCVGAENDKVFRYKNIIFCMCTLGLIDKHILGEILWKDRIGYYPQMCWFYEDDDRISGYEKKIDGFIYRVPVLEAPEGYYKFVVKYILNGDEDQDDSGE